MASATCSATCSAAASVVPSSRTGPAKGADAETTTTIGFTDAIEGVTISLRLTSDAPCPDCSGTGGKPGTKPHICPQCEGAGFVVNSAGGGFSLHETCPGCGGRQLVYDEKCPTCHGTGHGLSSRAIQARIPAGVKDGQRIRLRGKGSAGENGGPPGDLYVIVKVTPHRVFGRKGDNLTLDVPISFDEAALGADIKIPTLGGVAGHREGARRAPPTAAPSGSAARARRRPTARTATCSPPSRSRSRPSLDADHPRGHRGLPHGVRRPAAAREAVRGRT